MMTPEERQKLLEGVLKQAEIHEEEMRLSYLIARDRTRQAEIHEEEMRLSYLIARDRTRVLREQLKQPSLDSPERER